MAGVFISYSQKSLEPTKSLAQQLKDAGIEVWWDARLTSGQRFDEVIRNELEAAEVVVVIWTPESVKSTYVLMEAGTAYAWEKLVTVRTPDLPISEIPGPFRGLHTVLVSDLEQIMIALDEFGIRPKGCMHPVTARGNAAAGQAAMAAGFWRCQIQGKSWATRLAG